MAARVLLVGTGAVALVVAGLVGCSGVLSAEEALVGANSAAEPKWIDRALLENGEVDVIPTIGDTTAVATRFGYFYWVADGAAILRQTLGQETAELVFEIPDDACVVDIFVDLNENLWISGRRGDGTSVIWKIFVPTLEPSEFFTSEEAETGDIGVSSDGNTVYWVSRHREILSKAADGSGAISRVLEEIPGYRVWGVVGNLGRPFYTLNEKARFVKRLEHWYYKQSCGDCDFFQDGNDQDPPTVVRQWTPPQPGYVLQRGAGGNFPNHLVFRGLVPGPVAYDEANAKVFWLDLLTNRVLSRSAAGTGPIDVVFTLSAGDLFDVSVEGIPGFTTVAITAIYSGIPSAPESAVFVIELPT